MSSLLSQSTSIWGSRSVNSGVFRFDLVAIIHALLKTYEQISDFVKKNTNLTAHPIDTLRRLP